MRCFAGAPAPAWNCWRGGLPARLETLLRAAGIAAAPAQELTGTASLVALAASGMGVSIQPRSSLYGLDLGACRLLPLRPAALREIGVITPPGRTPSPATAAFHDYLVEHAASVAWPLLGVPGPHAGTDTVLTVNRSGV